MNPSRTTRMAIFAAIFAMTVFGGSQAFAQTATPTISARFLPRSLSPGKAGHLEVQFSGLTGGLQIKVKGTALVATAPKGVTVKAFAKAPYKSFKDAFGTAYKAYEPAPVFRAPVTVPLGATPGRYRFQIAIDYTGCTEYSCLAPQRVDRTVDLVVGVPTGQSTAGLPLFEVAKSPAKTTLAATVPTAASSPAAAPSSDEEEEEKSFAQRLVDKGGIWAFLGFYLIGLLMSLTPCVFPIVPITLAVIGASEHKGTWKAFLLALVHVFGIALTYGLLGVVAVGAGSAIGQWQNHPVFLGFVAIIFILLGLSMFDVFYLQLPSFLRDKLAGRRSKGYFGAFVAGLFAGLLAGPCTGPVLAGVLLVISQTANYFYGFFALFTVAIGMGTLLIVIGTFSSGVPRAGAWMEHVKHIFGLVMFLAALWFIRPLLSAEGFALVTAFIALATGIASWRLPESVDQAGWFALARRTFATMALVLGLYLFAGSLLVNGFLLPPLREWFPAVSAAGPAAPKAKITWRKNWSAALAEAKATKKPLMVAFKINNCPACLELDKFTFPHPAVVKESARFVAFKANMSPPVDGAIAPLQKRHSILGFPTIVFLSPDGSTEIKRSTGYVPAEKFTKLLKKLR